MSDFRDPREPLQRDPVYDGLNDPVLREMRADTIGAGTAMAWFVGIALFFGVLIYAFGSGEYPRVAETEGTPPVATQTQPAPAPVTPPAATPPAKSPTAPAQ